MKTFFILFVLFFNFCSSQKLKIYDFEDLEKQESNIKKPIIIHVYADWCRVCKIEMYEIAKNKDVLKLLNENYHFLNFDAEKTKETIVFNNEIFKYIPNGNSGIHELSIKLSNKKEKLVYPFWIFLDENKKLKYYHEGQLKPEDLKTILEK